MTVLLTPVRAGLTDLFALSSVRLVNPSLRLLTPDCLQLEHAGQLAGAIAYTHARDAAEWFPLAQFRPSAPYTLRQCDRNIPLPLPGREKSATTPSAVRGTVA